jgi:hypothetical protein
MAIYDISDVRPNPDQQELPLGLEEPKSEEVISRKVSFFSSFAARLFFFILLIADIAWGAYSLLLSLVALFANTLTFFRFSKMKRYLHLRYFSLKRSLVCAISLLLAIFSPSLGIMVASTYFLMYDKTGIDEVIPTSLQSQFREFLS